MNILNSKLLIIKIGSSTLVDKTENFTERLDKQVN